MGYEGEVEGLGNLVLVCTLYLVPAAQCLLVRRSIGRLVMDKSKKG